MKFRRTNDIPITTASLIDPLHWDAIIVRAKSLVSMVVLRMLEFQAYVANIRNTHWPQFILNITENRN